MAHEITAADAMISGRFITPWHGLGEVVEDFNVEDLRRIMGWQVEKFMTQTVTYFPNGDETLEEDVIYPMDTEKYATVRMPRNAQEAPIVLGAGLSRGYKVLQNEELIRVVEPFVQQGCALETAGTLRQGARVWIMLRLSGDINVKGDDQINSYILFSNDHTGAQAARIGMVGIRVVCQNTLNVAESGKASQLIRIMHQGDVAGNLLEVSKLLDTAKGQFINYGASLNHLANKGIKEKDLRKYVTNCFFAKADHKIPELQERIVNQQNKIIQLFETGEGAELASAKGTVYGAYQAVNHFLNHNRDISAETRLGSLVWGSRAITDRNAYQGAMKLAA